MKYSFLFFLFITGYSTEAQQVYFSPTSFYNKFSFNVAPVLTIKPGDTVITETVDAAGFDKNDVRRQKGGNPLAGPFYIENAIAGDVLAVTITQLSMNRNSAFTTESFSSRSVDKSIAKQFQKARRVNWKLDTSTGFATIADDSLYDHLHSFKVPLKPFVGCIGVAPLNKKNEILSFFQGSYGGNLDCTAVTQSATIYLPVFHDGAYFYIGDGHALQGDGEIAGNALETSLNVSFTIKVIKKDSLQIMFPRVEDSEYIIALGIAETLDDAVKIATSGLLSWLQQDYHLSLSEATQVMSTSIEYNIAEIADPEVEVAAKIKKELLNNLIR